MEALLDTITIPSPPSPTSHPTSSSSRASRPSSQLEARFTNLCYGPQGDSGSALIDSETGVELVRHSDLWFEDGSVVCRAENTLFKVHMSQLARHSVLFRDMFSLPQPDSRSHSDLTIRNEMRTPVVYLHDTAEDVGNLLTALYDGPYVCVSYSNNTIPIPSERRSFGNNDQDDFRIVSGILRLSTKYIVESLRLKALAHLSTAWPSGLKAWDLREDLSRAYEMGVGGQLYPHPMVCFFSHSFTTYVV